MVLLHILLAVAFVLLFIQTRRLDKLKDAFETQGEINKTVKSAFDLLVEDIENDRVLHDKTIKSVKASITKLKKDSGTKK